MKKLHLFHKDFNQKITFQKILRTPDGAGGIITNWIDHSTIWANVNRISISENFAENYKYQQINSTSKYKIIIRYRDDISDEMRILFKGISLDIKQIINNNLENKILTIISKSRAY